MNKNLQKNTKDELIEEVIKSRKEIKDLKDKIKDLEGKLNTNTTNSHNSSSSEKINKTTHKCNSRNNGGKKKNRGGQEGHKGKNLERNENVDETIDVSQENCEKCGASLLSNFAKVVKETVRQVIDIPPPSNIVKDYIGKYIKCPECGFLNKPNFPEGITQLVQYGNEVKTRTVYMYNHQTTSYERLSEYFYEIYNLDINQQSLCNWNKIGYEKLELFIQKLKKELLLSLLLHADETGVRMNGKNNWIHVNSTTLFTYYFPHEKRGKKAIDEMGIIPFFYGMLLTDHWASYKKYENILYHFFCLAHILRELLWSIENEKKNWPVKFKKLILDAKRLKERMIKEGKKSIGKEILDDIFTEYSEIIINGKTEYEESYQ